jgi:hypothetical protein
MPLSETQLSGLKKGQSLISSDDLTRVLTHLGLRRVATSEPGTMLYDMKITDRFLARAKVVELSVAQRRGFQVDLYVVSTETGRAVGPTHRTADAAVFQRRGAQIMAVMFESVDDLDPFQCPSCDEGLLGWDGRLPGRVTKPNMGCGSCAWKGHTGAFVPLRRLN